MMEVEVGIVSWMRMEDGGWRMEDGGWRMEKRLRIGRKKLYDFKKLRK
jgi:hypothetical protein